MEITRKILTLLGGKKTTIATILGAILVYCQGRGYVASDTANLIAVILVALGLGVNIVDYKLRTYVNK